MPTTPTTRKQSGLFYDKGGAVFNPMHPDFGAKLDGAADDTAAWLAVIAAARASGNGTVAFGPGVSLISAQLDFSSVSLVGAGPTASQFLLAAGFPGASALHKAGDGVTGEGRALLRGFSINGNRAAQAVASHGLLIEGNCLYGLVENVQVLGMKGTGVVVRNAGGLHPSLNTFRGVNVTDCDGDAWEIRSGQNLTFVNISGENVLGVGLNISGADEYVSNCLFLAPWIENVGTGKDGVVVDRSRNLTFLAPQVAAYGAAPATTGHGFNLTSPTSPSQGIVIEAPTITGRSASVAGSRQIYVGSAVRCELRRLPAGMTAADVELAGGDDTLVLGAYDASFASNDHIFFRNTTTALGASATLYLSANTGYADAVEVNANHAVRGRLAVVGLFVATTSTPGAGTAVFTLMKNGVATGLSVTVTSANFAAGVSSTAEVAFAPGDLLSLRAVGGASTIPIGGVKASLAVRR